MNIKIRRLIFYVLIVIFFILAFFIVPYSNGWRFDLNTFSFVKLGGLYLNVEPTEATVRIDKLSFEIRSTFMKSGLLIANLFPKTYYVSIQKNDYQSWNKNVTIKPSLVTQIYPILLIPNKYTEELVENNISAFFPNINFMAWKDTSNKLKIEGKTIKGTDFLAWLAGEKMALVYDKNTKTFLVINPSQNNSALNINLLFENLKYQKNITDKNPIKEVIGHPLDKNKIILSTLKNIFILDFYRSTLETIQINESSNIPDTNKSTEYGLFTANGDELFFTDHKKLYSYSFSNDEYSTLLDQNEIESLEISQNNQFIAFFKNNKLTLLDRSKIENNLTLLADSSSYYKFSPDSKKIAIIKNNKIVVYFLGDDHELFNKKLMETSSFEIDSLDKLSPITWHNSSCYLFVKSGKNLKFLEINDDLPINIQIISNNIDNYLYNKQEGVIYLIRDEILYKLIK